MAGGENFCLRLNEFKIFWKDLELGKDLYDVTLACEDKQIKAHKVIISSCSPILKNILKLNQNMHHVIYLRRVKYRDLQDLLTFMYQGEVNVAEEDIPSFLEVAEDLLIRGLSKRNKEDDYLREKGLAENNHDNIRPSSKRKRNADNDNKADTNSTETLNDFHEIFDTIIDNDHDEIIDNDLTSSASPIECQNEEAIKKETNEGNNKSLVSVNGVKSFFCEKCDKLFSSQPGLYGHNASVHEGVRYCCDQCDYKATIKESLKVHIKSVHEKLSVTCDKCDKQFSKKRGLRVHNKSVHEGVRYPCEYCDYKGNYRANLLQHKSTHHQID